MSDISNPFLPPFVALHRPPSSLRKQLITSLPQLSWLTLRTPPISSAGSSPHRSRRTPRWGNRSSSETQATSLMWFSPPRAGEGIHKPPAPMFFVLLSGMSQITFPYNNQEAWVMEGVNGFLVANDVKVSAITPHTYLTRDCFVAGTVRRRGCARA